MFLIHFNLPGCQSGNLCVFGVHRVSEISSYLSCGDVLAEWVVGFSKMIILTINSVGWMTSINMLLLTVGS